MRGGVKRGKKRGRKRGERGKRGEDYLMHSEHVVFVVFVKAETRVDSWK